MSNQKPILIGLKNAPGDSIVLTGAVRDLALQHPGRFRISVATNTHSVWFNNPHVVEPIPGCTTIDLTYGSEMMRANRGPTHTHFLTGFHNILSQILEVPLTPTLPRPDLHVGANETHLPVQGPYWVIFPGHKRDIPLKAWPDVYWQRLIDQLAGWGIKCVQVGREDMVNPCLADVHNLVGKTSIRDLFALIRDSEGVICGITQGMHIAAALEKPCVVLAGGRESWWWEAYVNENEGFGAVSGTIRVPHRFLHTFGMLSCCQRTGCFKQALFASRRHKPEFVCTQQTAVAEKHEAACMSLITPEKARDAVLSYYLDGTLPAHNEHLLELRNLMPDLLPVSEPLTVLRADGSKLEIKSTPAPTSAQTETNVITRASLPKRAPLVPHEAFDHPKIGGRVTICVMMYGDYFPMHKRCLDAILSTTAAERVELRIGGNQLCQKTLDYIELLRESGDIQVTDLSPDNRRKYPVMRNLFHNISLNTNWVVWFDDDTFCDADPEWLNKLVTEIANEQNPRVACWGPLYYYPLSPAWKRWCAAAGWYHDRPWHYHGTRALVNMASGSFWALSREAILVCDIPDTRLGHNKGDVTIGCQLHQNDYTICRFSQHKDIVRWSAVDRRGLTEAHPAEPINAPHSSQ